MSIKAITAMEFWPVIKKLLPDLPDECTGLVITCNLDDVVRIESKFMITAHEEVTESYCLFKPEE